MVGIGSIISVGGGGGGGTSGSTSGIQVLEGLTATAIGIDGANGLDVSTLGANLIIVDSASLSGTVLHTINSLPAANFTGQPNENVDVVGSGTISIFNSNGQVVVSGAPGIPAITGVNGLVATEAPDGTVILDTALVSGVNTLQTQDGALLRSPIISVSGIGVDVISHLNGSGILLVASGAVTSVNDQIGDVKIIGSGTTKVETLGTNIIVSGQVPVGIGGIEVTPSGDVILVDGSNISGVNTINGIRKPDITISGVNGTVVETDSENCLITIDANPGSGACFSETFTAITSGNFIHNFNTDNILVQVKNSLGEFIQPDIIQQQDLNSVDVTFSAPTDGQVDVFGCPSGVFIMRESDIDCFSTDITAVTSTTITHNLDTTAVSVSVYDAAGFAINPDDIQIVDSNNVALTFTTPTTGSVTVLGCGGTDVGINSVNGQTGPNVNLVAGSGIVLDVSNNNITINSETGLRKAAQTFVSSLTWTLVHNFNDSDVIVQTVDNTMLTIIPASIDTSNPNQTVVTFNVNQAGRMVVIG